MYFTHIEIMKNAKVVKKNVIEGSHGTLSNLRLDGVTKILYILFSILICGTKIQKYGIDERTVIFSLY